MTIEQDAVNTFENLSLEPHSHTANHGHLFADYAELLTLLRNGEPLSHADLVKRFEDFEVRVPQLSAKVAGPLNDAE